MLRCFWLLLPLGEGWDEGKKAQENVNFRLFKQPLITKPPLQILLRVLQQHLACKADSAFER
jgi:hypothetical protein